MLDTDQIAIDRQRAENARRLADDRNITIIWQQPCFEAVLLRHLPHRAAHRPDSQAAGNALSREWPEYRKPMPRALLARRIDLAAVLRAAAVEDGPADLPRRVRLL